MSRKKSQDMGNERPSSGSVPPAGSEVQKTAAEPDTPPVDDPRMSDPIFATLARPHLQELPKRNRAWLQIQSPSRIYFYWSLKNNPYQTLERAFGSSAGNYRLIVKLINLTNGWEEIHEIAQEGNWWFDIEPSCRYRAEIGFHSANSPYVRIIFSNTVDVPRRSPSPRPAEESEWAISAEKFAGVLHRAGFFGDAVEVSLAGDDDAVALERTRLALRDLLGIDADLSVFDAEEVRRAMLMLAAGSSLEDLRGKISEALYQFLSEHLVRLTAENSLEALCANFEIIQEEWFEKIEGEGAVFGASIIHFPGGIRAGRRTLVPHRLSSIGEGPSPLSSGR